LREILEVDVFLKLDFKHMFRKIKQYGIVNSVKRAMALYIFPQKYYSEYGEDIILNFYLPQKSGFYIDIGAFHPHRHSVTKSFYKRGWHGINIEPNPDAIKAFHKARKRDINLNIGVSNISGELDYYSFNKHPDCNTFDATRLEELKGYEASVLKIKVDTINNLLGIYLPVEQSIDFLTIDVEGFEYKIIESLDFEKYLPKHILLEDLSYYDRNKDFMSFKNSDLYKLLESKGYVVSAKIWCSILFSKTE